MKSHALFTLTVFCRLSLSSENAFDDLKECGFAGVFFSELADGHVRLGVLWVTRPCATLMKVSLNLSMLSSYRLAV